MGQGTVRSTVDAFRKQALHCPLPAAVELIGEKWAFLILRGAFNGLQHFEEFQAGLGIARNILSDRLSKLVARRDPGARPPTLRTSARSSMRLTTKGEGLLPVVLALRQWGEDWGPGRPTSSWPTAATAVRFAICVEAQDGRPVSMKTDVGVAAGTRVRAQGRGRLK